MNKAVATLADARGWIADALLIAEEIRPCNSDIRELLAALQKADAACEQAQEEAR